MKSRVIGKHVCVQTRMKCCLTDHGTSNLKRIKSKCGTSITGSAARIIPLVIKKWNRMSRNSGNHMYVPMTNQHPRIYGLYRHDFLTEALRVVLDFLSPKRLRI